MKYKLLLTYFVLTVIVFVESKKISLSSRGASSRGSSRKTNYNPKPAPTSFSYPQQSAPKPSLSGWQERPAQKSQPKQSNTQSHSYPSSNTGLSGSQQNIQKSNIPGQQTVARSASGQTQSGDNKPSHSYPSSNGGLSGNSGTGNAQQQGHGYPQQGAGNIQHGSGSPQQTAGGGYPQQIAGNGYPQQQGSGLSGAAAAPPPYSARSPSQSYPGGNYQSNNYGNSYHHPQGPPPPYSNYGSNYGGYGGHGSYNPGLSQQTPGYFGNYANSGKGFGGVSRTGGVSKLAGVGIAGAGIGTVLTGLALWNLARSTGNHHHTVIYDNRGQPVAVAPSNNDTSEMDSILADLANCTLTISTENATEVLAIPCSIATSFTPEADVKNVDADKGSADNTKCTVTVITKAGKEFMTTIPCSTLLNTAAENNVTEPAPSPDGTEHLNDSNTSLDNSNTPNVSTALKLESDVVQNNPQMNLNCTPHPGDTRDPINPCYAVTHDLTVIPLPTTTIKNDRK